MFTVACRDGHSATVWGDDKWDCRIDSVAAVERDADRICIIALAVVDTHEEICRDAAWHPAVACSDVRDVSGALRGAGRSSVAHDPIATAAHDTHPHLYAKVNIRTYQFVKDFSFLWSALINTFKLEIKSRKVLT